MLEQVCWHYAANIRVFKGLRWGEWQILKGLTGRVTSSERVNSYWPGHTWFLLQKESKRLRVEPDHKDRKHGDRENQYPCVGSEGHMLINSDTDPRTVIGLAQRKPTTSRDHRADIFRPVKCQYSRDVNSILEGIAYSGVMTYGADFGMQWSMLISKCNDCLGPWMPLVWYV